MLPEISEIIRLRKRFSLTQSELAKRASVSQSLVAKIESGRIDPAYKNVRKIFDVLNSLSEKNEHKAEEFMVRKIVTCSSSDHVASAIKNMKLHEISQLPVIDGGVAVGLVTESNLLEMMYAKNKDFSSVRISDVMQEAPPIVSRRTPMKLVLDLLRFSPLVLIADNGRFEGVVTKSDVLKFRMSS